MFNGVYLGLKHKDKMMQRNWKLKGNHSCFKHGEFSCATADEEERQLEMIHWSDLAEASTVGLEESSLEDYTLTITISELLLTELC